MIASTPSFSVNTKASARVIDPQRRCVLQSSLAVGGGKDVTRVDGTTADHVLSHSADKVNLDIRLQGRESLWLLPVWQLRHVHLHHFDAAPGTFNVETARVEVKPCAIIATFYCSFWLVSWVNKFGRKIRGWQPLRKHPSLVVHSPRFLGFLLAGRVPRRSLEPFLP